MLLGFFLQNAIAGLTHTSSIQLRLQKNSQESFPPGSEVPVFIYYGKSCNELLFWVGPSKNTKLKKPKKDFSCLMLG